MTNIVGLRGINPLNQNGSDPDVIQLLEHALERARTGDLRAVGLIMVCADGHLFTNNRGRGHKHELVAGCEYLKHDLCAEVIP